MQETPLRMLSDRRRDVAALLLLCSSLMGTGAWASDEPTPTYSVLAHNMARVLHKEYATDHEAFIRSQMIGPQVRYYPDDLDPGARQQIDQAGTQWLMTALYGEETWLEPVQTWLDAELTRLEQARLLLGKDPAAQEQFKVRWAEGRGFDEVRQLHWNRTRSKRAILDFMLPGSLAQTSGRADGKQFFGVLKVSTCYRLWPFSVTIQGEADTKVLRGMSCIKNTPMQLSASQVLLLDHQDADTWVAQVETLMKPNQIFAIPATVYQGAASLNQRALLKPVANTEAPLDTVSVLLEAPKLVSRRDGTTPLSVCAQNVPAQVVLRRAVAALDEELVLESTDLAMQPVSVCRDGWSLKELAAEIAPSATLLPPSPSELSYRLQRKRSSQ